MSSRPLAFGVVLLPSHPVLLADSARLAEEVGFEAIGLGDSPLVARELYLSLGVVAGATRHARIGATVTNLATRHPAVTASAIATLDEVSSGRAFLGLGSGDSAVYSVGLRATRVEEMREGISAIRSALAGRGHGGRTVRWSTSSPPLFLTAEGPRMIELAGEVADGVILGGGIDADSVTSAIQQVSRGLATAGRTRADIGIWCFAKVALAESRDAALRSIAMTLAAGANHAFRNGFVGKNVPPELIPKLEALRAAYRYEDHDSATGTNGGLVERFELTDWLGERFAIAGTPADCISGLEALRERGIDGVFVAALFDDPREFIREFGECVIAPLRANR